MTAGTWALLCEIGFWGWIGSAAGFILRCFPARNLMKSGSALGWGGSFLAFYALWIIGMINT
ncbi:MAG: hypothetical protein VB050_01555 [Geobacteraceae bacterium]|nr:hypothetical protein [Geobacteraceae bacterium]